MSATNESGVEERNEENEAMEEGEEILREEQLGWLIERNKERVAKMN